MAELTVFTAPVLHTVGGGVIVKRPDGQMEAPKIGPSGGFSIGASHQPGFGEVVHVAIHHPDGETLVMMMGAVGYNAFAQLFNAAGDAIQRGDFLEPEVAQ